MEINNIKLNYEYAPEDVNKFKMFGVFENNVDENGVIKLTSNNLTSSIGKLYYNNIPLKVYQYDTSKIEELNDVDFSEFIPEPVVEQKETDEKTEEILTDYNHLLDENERLNNTITDLINKYENNDNEQIIAAMKQEIIDLRIQLGQGNSNSDFSDDFPYLPK